MNARSDRKVQAARDSCEFAPERVPRATVIIVERKAKYDSLAVIQNGSNDKTS